MASCERTTWRGVIVCKHTVPKLNAWAEGIGNILLKPLAGCGSYQTTTTASAGTHAGGGAIDIDLRAVASDKRKWVADQGRLSGLQVAWHRDYVKGLWTWHCHALDPHCPNLANAAVAQIREYERGGDGLVGSRPDGNTRANVPAIMIQFATRFITDVAQTVSNDAKVKALQKAVRVSADGDWGKITDYWLWSVKTTAMKGETFFKSRVDRKDLQKHLGVAQTGNFDTATARAVNKAAVAMQKALGVTADGQWGKVTDGAYQSLRKIMYKAPATPKPTNPKPSPAVNTANIANNLNSRISRVNLKVGKKNNDVARYQAALWNKAAPTTRASWAKKWKVNRNQVADGVYGPATADLTKIHYAWRNKVDPKGGWTPTATEPGPGLLKHLGFKSII